MKTSPRWFTLGFVLLSLLSAHADTAQLLQEARAAGEKLGFTTIHQIRATFVPDRKQLQMEEIWLDVTNGSFKKVTRIATAEDADPLHSGNLPADLPIRSGSWQTGAARFFITPDTGEWRPTFNPPPGVQPPIPNLPAGASMMRDEREQALIRLSPDWMRAYGTASYERYKGNPDAKPAYPALRITDVQEEKKNNESSRGSFSDETTYWRGLVRHSARRMNGIMVELLDHKFEQTNDLTPSAALQAEAAKIADFMAKAKPMDPTKPIPFPGPPRRTYGFTFAPVTDRLEIRLRSVYPGSPAAEAGLRNDDVIVAVGEQKLADFPDRAALFAFITKLGAGPDEFTVQRGEETFKVRMEKVESDTFARKEE